MNNKKTTLILLFLIIILGCFLRFYKLGSIPPGPEWDEASVGYNAYSIAQTGRDEWGNKLPLIFPAFGDYKNPLYIYLTAGVVKLFGLNITTTRFINTLTGSLLILVWFFIADLIFKNKKISLLTAFLLAVSPFGIFYSRIAGDGMMLSVFLIGAGFLAELYFLKTKRLLLFIISILLLILSMFSYNLARIVSPLLMITIFIINFISVKTNRRWFVIPLTICLLSLFVIYKQSAISISSRLQYVGIFGQKKGVVLQINEFRDHDKNNLLSRIFHNKVTFFGVTLSSNYLAMFSSDFLVNFKHQTDVSESFWPPLHLILLPFYYLGLILLIGKITGARNRRERLTYLLLLALILVAPIPSAITEGGSGKRDLAALGTWEILSAYAAVYLLGRKKLSATIVIIILAVNLYAYFKFFYYTYPRDYGQIYAARENKICQLEKQNYSRFDYFIVPRKIDNVSYIFPLFCQQYSPSKYWQERQFTTKDSWFIVNRFDKYLFVDDTTTKDLAGLKLKNKTVAVFMNADERNLFVLQPNNLRFSPVLPVLKYNDVSLYMFSMKL